MWARFIADWRALPGENRRRWLVSMLAGTLAMFGLMGLLVQVAQTLAADGFLDWEVRFLHSLELHGPFGFSWALTVQVLGGDLTLQVLVLIGISVLAWSRRPISALSILLAFLVPHAVSAFGWLIWDRARPEFIAGGLAAPPFHSFPSGHTAKSLALYGFLAYIWWRASRSSAERALITVIMIIIMVAIPLSRLRIGVHWPSDIIGAYILGLAWLAILIRASWQEPLR